MPAKKDSEEKTQENELWEWFRSTDDPKLGFVEGNTFDVKPVQYSEIDGQAIFEGDIVLGPVADVEKQLRTMESDDPDPGIIAFGVGLTGERFRWPRGEVPYEIASGFHSPDLIRRAIQHWEQNTRIRFPLRTRSNAARYPNYVRFQDGNSCSSAVGMRGGRQNITINQNCGFGATVHEIGHAVGLWHEQSREDRNRFVRINWQNIDPNMAFNFNQHITDGDDIGGYDFGSIMHYGRFAFSRNGQPTIEPIGGQAIGQRNGLSPGDIAAVRAMYTNLEPSRSWAGVQFRGSVPANATRRWFTHSWPSHWYVVWTVVPTGPVQNSSAQLEWKVQVERQTENRLKYFIEVKNLSRRTVSFEARYNVLGWTRQAR